MAVDRSLDPTLLALESVDLNQNTLIFECGIIEVGTGQPVLGELLAGVLTGRIDL